MIRRNVAEIARRYDEVRRDIESSPTLLARFEQCGTVPAGEMLRIGGVGQAARASGAARDIRATHPWGAYAAGPRYEPVLRTEGDVMARLAVRSREVARSAALIERLAAEADAAREAGEAPCPPPDYRAAAAPSSLAVGLVEGGAERPATSWSPTPRAASPPAA